MRKLVSFIVFILASFLQIQAKPAFEKPENLTCEYLSNPIGIDIILPRLSWQLKSQLKNQRQSAYQILVATSKEKLSEDHANVWNTGKVLSEESIHIVFKGKPLKSKEKYYWKVCVWDNQGQQSGYSEAASWEMGLLKKTDWLGKWISAPAVYNWPQFIKQRRAAMEDSDNEAPMPAPQFRKSFTLTRKPVSARLYISGVGYNVPHLNGRKVDDHVLDPAFTRYDKTVLYTTHDVSGMMKIGENALGVVLGNGWYNMVSRGSHGFDKAPWKDEPTFISQLELTYDDGSTQVILSDETWKVAPGPIIFNSVRQGEFYDARLETPGWNNSGFNDATWYSPYEVSGPLGKLTAQLIPPIKIMEQLKPVKVSEPVKGRFLFKFAKNIAGFAKIRVKAPAGTEITLKYGEKLFENGLIDQTEIDRGIMDKPFQTDKYITKGEGIEEWTPSFVYHGFQYVEITGISRNAIIDLTGLVIHTAFESAGSFQCSNDLFNQIHENTLRSYKGNYHGVPTDCPQREKNPWTADGHLAAEMALYNFNNQRGYIKWLNDFADEQRPSGEIPAIIPTSGWGYHWGNGPAWDSALPLVSWYLYLYSGDKQILAEMYPNIKRYVDYVNKRSVNFIADFGLGDWAPAKTETPVDVTSTSYFYVDALILSKIARLLGKTSDEEKYKLLSLNIKKAFNDKFYKGNGIYANGSQTALSTALYQGLAEDDQKEQVVLQLAKAVKQNDNHLDAGILGTKFLLHALSDHGEAAVAYRIVNQRTFPSWGHWIEQGATTLWEKWDGSMSHNHVMFGDVDAWFYKSLAGIAPDEQNPGFKHIMFQPHFVSDLQWVKASHKSLYGKVSSSWSRKKNEILYEVIIPANTSGTLVLPKNKQIFIDGQAISKSDFVKYLEEESNTVKFTLGSGKYMISLK